MLAISENQLDALDQDAFDAFVMRLHEFLFSEHILDEVDLHDPLATTDRLVWRAGELGLSTEQGIARYAILAALFGEQFEELSNQSWYADLDRNVDEDAEPDWIDRVFQTIINIMQMDQEFFSEE